MFSSPLRIQYYKDTLLQTKRGNNKGVLSNAKPILFLSLIELIQKQAVENNRIYFSKEIEDYYKLTFGLYESNTKVTPFHKPFFHLSTDGYWHICWKEGTCPKFQAHTPSKKHLRENVLYAYLDDGLWNILQDAEARSFLHQSLIDFFIKPNNPNV